MRYCGSKRRFMKYLLPILTKDMDEDTLFVDLFCLCKDAFVFTRDGIKSISDINVGEEIVDDTSNFVKVVNKINVGKKKCFTFTLSGGIKFTCSENHRFYIDGQEIMAKDIRINDRLDCGYNTKNGNVTIDLSKYINKTTNKRFGRNGTYNDNTVKLTHISPSIKRYLTFNENIAKMYGLVVAEGCRNSLTMSINERCYLEEFIKFYETEVLGYTTDNCKKIYTKNNALTLAIPLKKIFEKIFFEALGIRHHACNKTISFLFNVKPNIVLQALRYMFMGDGCMINRELKGKNYRYFSYKTCSKNIAYELQALLKNKLNIDSCVYSGINKKRKIEGRILGESIYYNVVIRNQEDVNFFAGDENTIEKKYKRKSYKVKKIEECYEDCYDITINNNSHRFIINGGILTHNCGGANVISEIPRKNKVAVDYNQYVIALWKELQENGMKNIPTEVSEEMYNDVKNCYLNKTHKYKDFIIGYIGTCCSFGGSWFNGYARYNPNKKEDHIKEAYNGLRKQVENFIGLKTTVFLYSSYDQVLLHKNDIVYCDPPYASTKRYESDFNNEAFWQWAREASKKVKKLYVSEYEAPDDFECIWSMEKKDGLGTQKGKKQNTKVEKLFTLKN